MKRKTTLLVMAAGMGSRFGSLKQITPLGPHQKALLHYTIYDAVHAGFDKIVFVIRESFAKEFIDCREICRRIGRNRLLLSKYG